MKRHLALVACVVGIGFGLTAVVASANGPGDRGSSPAMTEAQAVNKTLTTAKFRCKGLNTTGNLCRYYGVSPECVRLNAAWKCWAYLWEKFVDHRQTERIGYKVQKDKKMTQLPAPATRTFNNVWLTSPKKIPAP